VRFADQSFEVESRLFQQTVRWEGSSCCGDLKSVVADLAALNHWLTLENRFVPAAKSLSLQVLNPEASVQPVAPGTLMALGLQGGAGGFLSLLSPELDAESGTAVLKVLYPNHYSKPSKRFSAVALENLTERRLGTFTVTPGKTVIIAIVSRSARPLSSFAAAGMGGDALVTTSKGWRKVGLDCVGPGVLRASDDCPKNDEYVDELDPESWGIARLLVEGMRPE